MPVVPSNPWRRRTIIVLLIPLLAYAALCALMAWQQRQLIYFPQFTRIDAAHTDFALPVQPGITLRGWRAQPDRDRALIYFGGNAESLHGLADAFAVALPSHGAHLLAYRGYGASDGEPTQDALFADAVALFDHLHAERPDRPIDVIGRSLGSGVAGYLASQRPVRRLILVTPFDSLADVAATHYPWLPVRWLLRDRFDTRQHLHAHRGEVLILRAGRDTVVPPRHADRLAQSLPQPPRVIDLADADHAFDLFADEVLPTWRDALLGTDPPR